MGCRHVDHPNMLELAEFIFSQLSNESGWNWKKVLEKDHLTKLSDHFEELQLSSNPRI